MVPRLPTGFPKTYPLVMEIAIIAISVVALGFSSVTLVLLLAWKRDNPDVSKLNARIHATDTALTDLADRCNHWFRRQSTRQAREKNSRGDLVVEEPVPQTRAEHKRELRERFAKKGLM